ncbi:MAG: HAD-IIIC family phosphatase [Thermodesulfobacteriota bacterium]|nr:HAD-IIIC family phosphatase [Thermodesulfobacteriota bacterium]
MLARRALATPPFYEYPWLAKELARCVAEPFTFRLGLLSTFTFEPIRHSLSAVALAQGFELKLYFGGFQQLEQEVMILGSGLARHKPQVIVVAWRLADLSPLLWHSPLDLTESKLQGEIEGVLDRAVELVRACRNNLPQSHLILHTVVPPDHPVFGVVDFQHPRGHQWITNSINAGLRKLATETEGVHLLDCEAVARRIHGEAWFDARHWYTARAPLAAEGLVALAYEYVKYLRALSGKTKKVLVTDLDNTLWGGILGEDGFNGIALGETYPGNAFLAFQWEMKMLSRRGVLLAINSKNNEADVREVFEKHQHMALDWNAFAAVRVNWQDKATNMVELAEDLSLGLDSFVFIDDNPYELEMVHQALPEVTVIKTPKEPSDLPGLLSRLGYFESVVYSDADRKRTEFYSAQAKRAELKRSSRDLDAFYRSLSMKLTVYEVGEAETPRVAQLTQRTNQFNMTTRRYSEVDIKYFRNSPAHLLRAYHLEDRFGDNGIIAVVVVKMDRETWYLDSFLMSCRVIGRAVETAILALLIQEAKRASAAVLKADFLPSEKNTPARDVYAKHGFRKVEESPECIQWEIDVAEASLEGPEFFEVIDTTKKTEGKKL